MNIIFPFLIGICVGNIFQLIIRDGNEKSYKNNSIIYVSSIDKNFKLTEVKKNVVTTYEEVKQHD